ncbi:hypothetical protein AVEN_72432-1 [Araneus ventricosus]|uniref:Uncharacterized protein n=1 Tax=Araneus ventricosus TaxID=182803 RepID=A0A4Y2JTN8_ARAVE|nr:hypothetical protein AVEN_72432-1 [Araneus ventricosus]
MDNTSCPRESYLPKSTALHLNACRGGDWAEWVKYVGEFILLVDHPRREGHSIMLSYVWPALEQIQTSTFWCSRTLCSRVETLTPLLLQIQKPVRVFPAERSSEFRLGIVESKHELGIDCTSRKWQFHRSGNKLPECSEAPLRKGMELEWE